MATSPCLVALDERQSRLLDDEESVLPEDDALAELLPVSLLHPGEAAEVEVLSELLLLEVTPLVIFARTDDVKNSSKWLLLLLLLLLLLFRSLPVVVVAVLLLPAL